MFLKNKYLNTTALFYALLVIISTIIFMQSIQKTPQRTGDWHEYYMMAESFVNHGSFNMTEFDREKVTEKAKHYNYRSYYIDRSQHGGYFENFNGKYYSRV